MELTDVLLTASKTKLNVDLHLDVHARIWFELCMMIDII